MTSTGCRSRVCSNGVRRGEHWARGAVNVFVSSTEPGRVEWVHHGDLTPDWGAFRLLCGLWRHLKGYDPRCAGN